MLFIREKNDTYQVVETDIRIKGGGWMLVSPDTKDELLQLLPYVKLALDGDVIVAVEEDEERRNNPPAPPNPTHDPQEDTDAMLVDHEFRLALLELGGV